jgi:glucose-6-phosphate isomerase
MFGGKKITITENRAVLHVALRAPQTPSSPSGSRRQRSASLSLFTSTASSPRAFSGVLTRLTSGASNSARCWLSR